MSTLDLLTLILLGNISVALWLIYGLLASDIARRSIR